MLAHLAMKQGRKAVGRARDQLASAFWPLTDGEVHYFYWFMQGSIMIPETRWRLRDSLGLCERHAWGALAVETAFRHSLLLGPTILYVDLMERVLPAFAKRRPWRARRTARALRARRPCMVCEMNMREAGRGVASVSLIERGRRTDRLQALAHATRAHWQPMVCGRCGDDDSAMRCRLHLIADLCSGHTQLVDRHRQLAEKLHRHLVVYDRSFVFAYRGTETPADRAALIASIGWLSGWRPLLALLGEQSRLDAAREAQV